MILEIFKEEIAWLKNYLFSRKQAYQVVFNKDSIYAEKVLADLARYCKAHETVFTKDERLTLILEGRREVWLRIQKHLNLTNEEFWKLFGRKDLE